MEIDLIGTMKEVLPDIDVFHDFAPDNATAPFVVLQRVGGMGNRYVDEETGGGYEVRFQVSAWAVTRVEAIELSQTIESALRKLPTVYVSGAAIAGFDPDTDLRGMQQDFLITA